MKCIGVRTKYVYSMYSVCYMSKSVHKVCNEHTLRVLSTLTRINFTVPNFTVPNLTVPNLRW